LALFQLMIALPGISQDLDARAYTWIPVRTTNLIMGFSYSFGGVVSDPTLPVKNIDAQVEVASIGVARSFKLFGLTSQAMVVLPYGWAQVSGDVGEVRKQITRSGFADMRLRWSVLLLGAPAATLPEIKKTPRKTIVGLSLNMILPTGEYFSDKLINLGTNRFSFRPELALSQPISKRWLFDLYAGVWFFTNNQAFYPGDAVRSQKPMGTVQGHLSYNISPRLWVALNATYYAGGTSTVGDKYNDDRQSNSRIGITGVMPVMKRNALKLSVSKGAIVRSGQNFTTVSVGWQTTWLGKGSKVPISTPE
jgi:hypothetical protein